MSKVINKKGISLVALIITIIVLIVLTGAVIMTGVNVPSNAQLAVFKSNVATVQDAVTIKMLNNMVEYMDLNSNNVKWIGVANGYEEGNIASAPTFGTNINGVAVVKLDSSIKENLSISDEEFAKYHVDANGIVYHEGFSFKGITYYNVNTSVVEVASIAITSQMSKTAYTVNEIIDITGLKVIATYTDGTTKEVTNSCTFSPALMEATETTTQAGQTREIQVSYGGKTASQKIGITVENWYDIVSSNANVDSVESEEIDGTTYYAPIPKGFTVSEETDEDDISEGLVIKDGSGNEFVWVPVNDSYVMVGDASGDEVFGNRNESYPYGYDMPYLDNNTTTALEYWKSSLNGKTGNLLLAGDTYPYSEPYTNAGSWEKQEYKAMVGSVLKYGGFYVGRYETGVENGTYDSENKVWSNTSTPVVKSEADAWNYIMWNNTDTMDAQPAGKTATAVSRGMYASSDYGVASTLIYGIQWDSIMNWANCYNKTRATNTYSTKPSKTGAAYSDGTTYDVEKNIYDLAGNLRERTMEAGGTTNRIYRSGIYNSSAEISNRSSHGVTFCHVTLGFRTALYVK